MKNIIKRPFGFTLIELLVVIVIIVLLIAILIPALAAAKKYAQNMSTTAQLQSLSSAIDMYHQTFNNNYPGPEPAGPLISGTSVSTSGANNGKKITGSQNLLLGLTYAVYAAPFYGAPAGAGPAPQSNFEPNGLVPPSPPSNLTTGWVTIPGASSTTSPYKAVMAYVNPMDTTGPLDLSVNPMTNNPPFYRPTNKEMSAPTSPTSNTWYVGGVNNIASTTATLNTFAFPTIVDRYPDAMPILYYRRMAGVDGTANSSASPVTFTQGAGSNAATAAIAIRLSPSASNVASYYYDENIEYTEATGLSAASGATFAQGQFNKDLLAAYIVNGSATLTSNLTASSSFTARGGYILISAGYDHIYGVNPTKNTTDDIVVVGGAR